MFFHNKALQYTVRVGETNPGLGERRRCGAAADAQARSGTDEGQPFAAFERQTLKGAPG